jgi:hypothetical protein
LRDEFPSHRTADAWCNGGGRIRLECLRCGHCGALAETDLLRYAAPPGHVKIEHRSSDLFQQPLKYPLTFGKQFHIR